MGKNPQTPLPDFSNSACRHDLLRYVAHFIVKIRGKSYKCKN
jgi:hypothetical protein